MEPTFASLFRSFGRSEHNFSNLIIKDPKAFFSTEYGTIPALATALCEEIFSDYRNPHDLKYKVMGYAVGITSNEGPIKVEDSLYLANVVLSISAKADITCNSIMDLIIATYVKIKK
jgi:hypothetical protein